MSFYSYYSTAKAKVEKEGKQKPAIDLIGQSVIFLTFFDRRDNFSTFAEASTTTHVLHCTALKKLADRWLPQTIPEK